MTEANSHLVAGANSRIIHYSFGQVYAVKKTFPYFTPDMQFHHDKTFMERFEPFKKLKPEEKEKIDGAV